MTHESAPHSRRLRDRIRRWLKKPLAQKRRSLLRRGRQAISWLEDLLFEKWHGIDCGGHVSNDELETPYTASLPHATRYEPVRCHHVRQLINEAQKTGVVFENFIDLGSGKGKACFYAASRRLFRQILGVEFSGPLVQAAQANNGAFGAANISFVHSDAATFSLPPGNNLIYLFNPFDEFILRKFVEHNIEHFREMRSVIAYANDHHRLCLTRLGFGTLFRNQDTKASLHQYIRT